jgi:hypothetical protein
LGTSEGQLYARFFSEGLEFWGAWALHEDLGGEKLHFAKSLAKSFELGA